jgi:aryl-alcohol dehydrogenase-like predicted oxidoreductase
MEYRRMGLSGARVSSIGVGGNQFGRRVDEPGTAAIIDKAVELGVNFIDTADSYSNGVSEEFIGKAIGRRRGELVIATKTGNLNQPPGRLSRRQIVLQLEGSLRRLRTDYVDLYYLHFPEEGTPLEESLRALDDMTRAGKILYPAISNHPAWQVAEAFAICDRFGYARPVVTQNAYNMLDRAPEAELLPACKHFGLSLVPYSPLAEGFLTGKYVRGQAPSPGVRGHGSQHFKEAWLTDSQFARLERYEAFARERGHSAGDLAIAWLLANPLVCSVIAGVTSPAQLQTNVAASEWRPEPEELLEL